MLYVEQIIEISSGLLTLLIAIVAVYIAWQQWKTNKFKLKLELYEKRLRIYKTLKKILDIVLAEANVSWDELQEFRSSVSESDFLFRSEIPKYLDEIFKHGTELWRCSREYRDITQTTSEDYDHGKVANGMNKEREWFAKQSGVATEKFKKYLDISK